MVCTALSLPAQLCMINGLLILAGAMVTAGVVVAPAPTPPLPPPQLKAPSLSPLSPPRPGAPSRAPLFPPTRTSAPPPPLLPPPRQGLPFPSPLLPPPQLGAPSTTPPISPPQLEVPLPNPLPPPRSGAPLPSPPQSGAPRRAPFLPPSPKGASPSTPIIPSPQLGAPTPTPLPPPRLGAPPRAPLLPPSWNGAPPPKPTLRPLPPLLPPSRKGAPPPNPTLPSPQFGAPPPTPPKMRVPPRSPLRPPSRKHAPPPKPTLPSPRLGAPLPTTPVAPPQLGVPPRAALRPPRVAPLLPPSRKGAPPPKPTLPSPRLGAPVPTPVAPPQFGVPSRAPLLPPSRKGAPPPTPRLGAPLPSPILPPPEQASPPPTPLLPPPQLGAPPASPPPLVAPGGPKVPALIAFGDSIVDTGNNNYLPTVVKANFPPYGKEYPGHKATGRFSDGKITVDFIASALGLKETLPPYLNKNLTLEDLKTGVTFASAGSGYNNATCKTSSTMTIERQLQLFTEYKVKVGTIPERALYIVCSGSNDIVEHFTLADGMSSPEYADMMAHRAIALVERLIGEGARQIALTGAPPVGCVPSQRRIAGGVRSQCATDRNQLALMFNRKLSLEAAKLAGRYRGINIFFVDLYSILADVVTRYKDLGFQNGKDSCCGYVNLAVGPLCNMGSRLCPDPSQYVFWDSYHPTERAYKIMIDEFVTRYIRYIH